MPGTKPRRSPQTHPDPDVSGSEVSVTAVPTVDEILTVLWQLASDPEKPATAQVKALELCSRTPASMATMVKPDMRPI